jgi:hypothetical protein
MRMLDKAMLRNEKIRPKIELMAVLVRSLG